MTFPLQKWNFKKAGWYGDRSSTAASDLIYVQKGSEDHPDFESKEKWVSDGVNAVVTISVPVDLLSMGDWHDNPNSPESKFLGGSVDNTLTRQSSPITYITEKTPPVFIIHGDFDGICPVQQSQLLHQQLPNSSYLEIKGADHDLVGGLLAMMRFLLL